MGLTKIKSPNKRIMKMPDPFYKCFSMQCQYYNYFSMHLTIFYTLSKVSNKELHFHFYFYFPAYHSKYQPDVRFDYFRDILYKR